MQVAARSGPGEWFVASTFARSFMALTHQPYASVPWPAEIHGSRSIRAGQNKAAHGLTLFSSPVGAPHSAAPAPSVAKPAAEHGPLKGFTLSTLCVRRRFVPVLRPTYTSCFNLAPPWAKALLAGESATSNRPLPAEPCCTVPEAGWKARPSVAERGLPRETGTFAN